MKKLALLLALVVVFSGRSDEGMFLPFTLKENYADMQAHGLKLNYKDIYHPKKPSIKDAIVSFGGFCTAEIISPQGLLLTNHHCGYDAIREQSTPENDYLTDGFWAMDKSEELPIEGLTASVIVEVKDVTKKVLSKLDDSMTEEERALAVRRIGQELADKAVKGTNYSARVKEFYGGNEYYLIIEETFEDIRLVGAPPSSIGKYGGDTDNWMWTRHTGDFSMFRIYADANNKPAPFSIDNKPYQPKHFLPISIKGVEKDDFAFIMGFPGSTDRFLTSYGVKMAVETEQPSRVKIRGKKLEIMKEEMNKSDEVRLQYASTYAQVSNYWKYFIGQTEQLQKNGIYDKKKAIEDEFQAWVDADAKRQQKYGNVLDDFEDAYKTLTKYNPTTVYFLESVWTVAVLRFVIRHESIYKELEKEDPDMAKIKTDMQTAQRKYSEAFFEGFNRETEAKVVAAMFSMFMSDVPKDQQPEYLRLMDDEVNGGWDTYVPYMMEQSIFTNKDKYDEYCENPVKSADMHMDLFSITIGFIDMYREIQFGKEMTAAENKMTNAKRLFIQALREMYPDKNFYPDANFTLRLTYGNVLPYSAHGKDYKYYTTIEGLMAKEDPNNDEFIVPAKLKELYEAKDYGRYGKDGTLWINFLTDNDITGGNSGSPVINGNGELIGTAFDGNWEAMSGDIAFEPDFQRTISCDIRYVLFIVDKYAGATHLIDEMTIVE